MTGVLRIYDPAECDPHGVPLDWESCRACEGRGRAMDAQPIGRLGMMEAVEVSCPRCGGHGSLKAAALAAKAVLPLTCGCGSRRAGEGARGGYGCPHCSEPFGDPSSDVRHRCEDCGHPMSDGTWAANQHLRGWEPWTGDTTLFDPERTAERRFVLSDPDFIYAPHPFPAPVHFSRCDEGCRHGGPARVTFDSGNQQVMTLQDARIGELVGNVPTNVVSYGASWRPVDVRTRGWPHDLSPEKLAVLCLRCHAARTR